MDNKISPLLIASTAFLGVGLSYLFFLHDTPIGSALFMNYSVPLNIVSKVDTFLAGLLLLCSLLLLVPKIRVISAVAIFIIFATYVYAMVDQGGSPFTDYAFFANAMRLVAPLALIIYSIKYDFCKKRILFYLIAIGICFTFISHGFEAILAHPWFVDMTIVLAKNTLNWAMSESIAEKLLLVVGVVDILSALTLIIFRSKIAAIWLSIWGFFTCFLRLANYGMGGLPDFIIRLPHGILPIVALLLIDRIKKEP